MQESLVEPKNGESAQASSDKNGGTTSWYMSKLELSFLFVLKSKLMKNGVTSYIGKLH